MVMERKICFGAKQDQLFHPHSKSPLRTKWVKTGENTFHTPDFEEGEI